MEESHLQEALIANPAQATYELHMRLEMHPTKKYVVLIASKVSSLPQQNPRKSCGR